MHTVIYAIPHSYAQKIFLYKSIELFMPEPVFLSTEGFLPMSKISKEKLMRLCQVALIAFAVIYLIPPAKAVGEKGKVLPDRLANTETAKGAIAPSPIY